MAKHQHIVLFDGNNIYRRMHGGMKTVGDDESEERAYSAMNATQEKIFKITNELSSTHCCVFFDGEDPTWRSEVLPEYKFDKSTGAPKQKPQAMVDAIRLCQSNISQTGIKTSRIENHEADDSIATIANILRDKPNTLVTIVSTDKDFNPLVYGNVRQYHPFDKISMDEDYVKEKRGCSRQTYMELLTMSGDASDNIPGVPGVGDKRGLKLLKEYGDLDTLILCSEAIGGKAGEWITDNPDKVRDYRKLIDLSSINVELGFSLREMRTPEKFRNKGPSSPQQGQKKDLHRGGFSYGY